MLLKSLITACLATAMATASQITLYSSLGPGQSYDNTDPADGFGSFLDETQGIASLITATSTGTLTQALLPVVDQNRALTFDLFAFNGTNRPGTLLQQWNNVTVPIPASPYNYSLVTLTQTEASMAAPTLSAGTSYWFVAVSGPISGTLCPEAQKVILNNYAGYPGCSAGGESLSDGVQWDHAKSGTGGGWFGLKFFVQLTAKGESTTIPSPLGPRYPPPALELEGTAAATTTIPEPASFGALLAGLAALVAIRKLLGSGRPLV
jgi:hypothetical protein